MFKTQQMTIILYYLLLCAVHMLQCFISEKMLQGNCNYSQDRSFLKGNEENFPLVLSNVHNRTSARDGPMFGSKGPSMNTSSLDSLLQQNIFRRPPSIEGLGRSQGVTKRCRLYWLQCPRMSARIRWERGGRVAGSQPMSTAVQCTVYIGAQINFGLHI